MTGVFWGMCRMPMGLGFRGLGFRVGQFVLIYYHVVVLRVLLLGTGTVVLMTSTTTTTPTETYCC